MKNCSNDSLLGGQVYKNELTRKAFRQENDTFSAVFIVARTIDDDSSYAVSSFTMHVSTSILLSACAYSCSF